jgi:hypothetical protein
MKKNLRLARRIAVQDKGSQGVNFTDNIWAAIGANIFGGGEVWNQFGQLRKNDNIYSMIRYEF